MTSFTIRVKLHDADSEDYEMLHEKMKAKKFFKTITSSEGVVYELPTAEYDHTSSKTQEEILDIVYGIAKSVNSRPTVLVTAYKVRICKGLKKKKF